jgi:hypothetical protein
MQWRILKQGNVDKVELKLDVSNRWSLGRRNDRESDGVGARLEVYEALEDTCIDGPSNGRKSPLRYMDTSRCLGR